MRKSVIHGFVAVACVAMLGSGCETLHKWCGCGKKKAAPVSIVETNLPPPVIPADIIDSNDNAQVGVPFDQLPIDANAKLDAALFAYDSSLLPPKEVAKVEKAGQYLLDHPDRVMNVDGHCDERGSNEYNLSLGEQRAQSVRKFLLDLGIDGSRIQTRSFGKEKPLDPGHNEAAWAKNRRGEFTVYIKK
jgi:peptidoglycan-associated lipoprotein